MKKDKYKTKIKNVKKSTFKNKKYGEKQIY